MKLKNVQKYLGVTLKGTDLEEVITLASTFSRGSEILERHTIGAAGQIAVRKAIPELPVNGRKYHRGDGWSDYIGRKIDTKTCRATAYMPHLWLPRDLVCDRECDHCASDRNRCRPLLTAPAQIYIGVVMDPYQRDRKIWCGQIYGFVTTRKLQELYRIWTLDLKVSKLNNAIGYPASLLDSIHALQYYIVHRHDPKAHLWEFFCSEDLDVLDSVFVTE